MTVMPLERQRQAARLVVPSAGFALDPMDEHDAWRGEMRRQALRPGLRQMRRSRLKSPYDLDLKVIPEASAFWTDPALRGPVSVIREYRAHQFAREAWDLTEIVFQDGAARMEGDWLSVALFRTECAQPRLRTWYDDWAEICFPLCGFKKIPSYNTTWLRFAELEANLGGVRWLTQHLISNALLHVPSMFDFVFFDGTPFRSRRRPMHSCLDEDACREAPTRATAALKTSPLLELLEAKARVIETDTNEDPSDERNQRRVASVVDENGELMRAVAIWTIDGHDYMTDDFTSGFRRYGDKSWFGGQNIELVSPVVRLAGAITTLPAHIMEYEPLFTMLDDLHEVVGDYPYALSHDRGASYPSITQGLTHRGVATIAPRRWTNGEPNRHPLERRRERWDEDGIPHCAHCKKEASYDLPGLGLFFTARKDGSETAWLRYRCLIPESESCEQVQKISCDDAPTALVPWSRLSGLYNDLRSQHHPLEGGFDVSRDNYAIAGKDSTCMPRAGVNVQRLHSHCGQALDWFKLNLRHGWLPAKEIRVKLNEDTLRSLATEQDRLTGEIRRRGIGTERLERRLAARRANDTDLPYELKD